MSFSRLYVHNCFLNLLLVPIIFTVFLNSREALAQTYQELAPGSSYACITFPSGKTSVGKASKRGYAVKDFDEVKDLLKEEIDQHRARIKRLGVLKKELTKSGKLEAVDAKAFKGIFLQFAKGEPYPNANADKLIAIDTLTSLIQSRIAYAQLQTKALTNCRKKKLAPLTSLASRTIFFKQNDGGAWFEYLLVDRGAFNPDSVAHCVFPADLSYGGRRLYAETDPCARTLVATYSGSHTPFTCSILVPKGTLAILINYALPTVLVGTGYDFSEASLLQTRARLINSMHSPYLVRETNSNSDNCQTF